MTKAVLDTNVLVAGRLQLAVTTPLMLEYESVLTRPGLLPPTLSSSDLQP